MIRRSSIVGALALLTLPGAAGAHEFWITCDTPSATDRDVLRVQLHHGERFDGEVVRRDESKIARFEVVDAQGAAPILGQDGARASYGRATGAGAALVVYQSMPIPHRLEAEAFEDYLRVEGLAWAIEERERRAEREAPGIEEYVRCAKAVVGSSASAAVDREVGLPLEIVIESIEGDRVRARVLYQGKAIEGLTVTCARADAPGELTRSATDASGLVNLPAPGTGPWMLTTIHMARLGEDLPADWRSYWASTTFGLD